jgi:enoyl-ACP reductase-like protein
MFSNNLANEVAGRGVRINCVDPARVLTERMERRVPNGAKRQAASVPLGRMGTPEDVAATLLLVSAASAWITGVTLDVAGGARRCSGLKRYKAPRARRPSYYPDGRTPMKQRNSLSSGGKVTVAALLVAAFGFVIQIFSGIEVPTVPPGLVILLVAAGLVALSPWRWIPAVGIVVGLFMFVGYFASGAVGNLLDPSRFGVLVGAWIQFLSVIVAIVAGGVATAHNHATRS